MWDDSGPIRFQRDILARPAEGQYHCWSHVVLGVDTTDHSTCAGCIVVPLRTSELGDFSTAAQGFSAQNFVPFATLRRHV